MKNYLSVDLGGTFVKYALVQEDGYILIEGKNTTPNNLNDLLELINKIMNSIQKSNYIEGIAISSPGTITKEGLIIGTSSIPYLYNINLKKTVQKYTNKRTSIENDANCSALAELWLGEAQKYQDTATIVIGTGIGGALIFNGTLYKGKQLYAGEFGYNIMCTDLETKTISHWSKLASMNSLIENVSLKKNIDANQLSGEQIFEWATEGDFHSKNSINDFYFMLAIGIHNIQHAYDPECILIGGGISSRDEFIPTLTKKVKEVQSSIDLKSIEPNLRACKFKNQANLIGAVYHYLTDID